MTHLSPCWFSSASSDFHSNVSADSLAQKDTSFISVIYTANVLPDTDACMTYSGPYRTEIFFIQEPVLHQTCRYVGLSMGEQLWRGFWQCMLVHRKHAIVSSKCAICINMCTLLSAIYPYVSINLTVGDRKARPCPVPHYRTLRYGSVCAGR
jgi:hypothetical protein